MHKEIRVPLLEINEEPIRVNLWLVERGATVTLGDRVVELLAGPATIDLPSPGSGRLIRILVGEDETVAEGDLLGLVEVDDDA